MNLASNCKYPYASELNVKLINSKILLCFIVLFYLFIMQFLA